MIHKYFVAILPPDTLGIHHIRIECSRKFDVYKALKPPPHITLYSPFSYNDKYENRIIDHLNSACNMEPFTQKLENFDGFPDRAVYINALKNEHIFELKRNIHACLDNSKNGIRGVFRPHITIAYRDIKNVYSYILDYYKDKEFKKDFIVHGFSLLKHNGKFWEVLRNYEFKPSQKQLSLNFN